MRSDIKRLKEKFSVSVEVSRFLPQYQYSRIQSLKYKKHHAYESKEQYDLVFVVLDLARDWILEAICREIASFFPGTYCFHYSQDNLPPAKSYYFAHYSFLPICLKRNPRIWNSKRLVWYSHPRTDLGISNTEIIYSLNHSTKVICTCSQFADLLVHKGVSADKVTYILGAADPELFKPHTRGIGSVGFCTAFYYRKEPDRILEIVAKMPNRKFMLVGKNWQKYPRFDEMNSLKNFSYIEVPYSEYPQCYEKMDVFVSPSKLEGGPIPLIESMMCNVVPVASNTGFAPDLIEHGKNGFIFDVDASTSSICQLIDKAFEIKVDVRESVKNLTWNNFSLEIQALLN